METLNSKNIGDRTRQSVKWSFILQFVQKVVMFLSTILLARILTPQDFGLVAMSLTIDVITQMASSMGVNSSVIHFQDNFRDRLNASFWLIITSGFIFSSFQFLIAPLAAQFYGAPLLKDIIQVSAVALFINASVSTHKSILIKNMEFKKVSILEASVNIGRTLLSIILALSGFGVWSFIYPKVVGAVINLISLLSITKWIPSLNPNIKYWKEMFLYGKNVLLSTILDYCINNSGYILIGNYLGSLALGIYTFAYDKSMMVVNNIAYPVQVVAFPAFSKLQDDEKKLKEAFINAIKLIAIVSFPYAIGQIVAGHEYVRVIFGEKWTSSVILFQIILCYAMFRSVSQTVAPILLGIGKPDVLLKCGLVYTPFFVGSLFIGYKIFGLVGVAVAAALTGIIGAYLYMYILVRILNWKMKEILMSLSSAFLSSLFMGLCILTVKNSLYALNCSEGLVLFLEVLSGLVFYTLSLKVFFPSDFDFITGNLFKFINKKRNKSKEKIVQPG